MTWSGGPVRGASHKPRRLGRIPTAMSLRVFHIVETPTPDAGSVAISLQGLITVLRERGIESEVTASPEPGRFDVLHVHGWGYAAARLAAKGARQARKPYVISPHGMLAGGGREGANWAKRLRVAWSERGLVRNAAAVTAMNEYELALLHEAGIRTRLEILPYGLRCDDYEGSTGADVSLTPPEASCVLMLGPIEPTSGCVALLKAFAELGPDASGWSVVFAGRETGDWRKMLEAAVRRKGGEGRVTFASAPDFETQRAWLGHAAVLAVPSLQVRFEVSILQAVAAGVPVVASTCATPVGLESAIRVCAPNREALREGLRSVLRLSSEERTESAGQARVLGRGVFDWSVLVDRYVRLYEDLV